MQKLGLLVLAGILAMGSGVLAAERVRCGTADTLRPDALRAPEDLARWAETNAARLAAACQIPVAFHVIYEVQNGEIIGDVFLEQIDQQINQLTQEYRRKGFTFYLFSVDAVESHKWSNLKMGSAAEKKAKRALAITPESVLNVYTVPNPKGGLLGWATFPWMFASEADPRAGVVIDTGTLPGGDEAPYDLGATLVHEAGHYLGLFHTFQDGCSGDGDYCEDTAAEREAAFGCPVGRDTCVGDGPDPIHNFMDYSDDDCLFEFTQDQKSRMNWAVSTYRPSLCP
jgi:hypothetical protein